MTQEEILEGNKLIAEWLGMSIKLGNFKESFVGWYETKGMLSVDYIRPESLQFHSSWDWLVPIIHVINALPHIKHGHILQLADLEIAWSRKKIEEIFESVIKFITWYNTATK